MKLAEKLASSSKAILTPEQQRQKSIEDQRKKWSIFCDQEFVSEHSLKLEQAAKSLGKVCRIQSMCVFSANPRAGQQVAVVVDSLAEYSDRIRARIAERCPEPFLAIIQPPPREPDTPGKSSELDREEEPVAVVYMLAPGGPVVRSMCHTMALAACTAVADSAASIAVGNGCTVNLFPALVRDGRTVVVRAEGDSWREDLRVRLEEDGNLWASLPAPRLMGLVPIGEVRPHLTDFSIF
jgi:hypothetical protein